MCLSPEASFAVGGALIPVGGYCLWSALRKKPNAWGLAVVPLGFGVQQISEGFVWLGIQAHDPDRTHAAALAYLFFALAFWPFWFPFMAALSEADRKRKWILGVTSLIACTWFWVLFFPLLGDPGALKIDVVHHSIQYDIWSLPIYSHGGASRPIVKLIYLLSLAAPFVLSSDRGGWIPGVLLGLSVVAAELAYHHAFISVWCFLAAVMTSYIGWMFYRLPWPSELSREKPG